MEAYFFPQRVIHMQTDTPSISPFLTFYRQYFDEIYKPSENTNFYNVACPFHDDATPSAGFSKQTGIFHCFTCNMALTMPKFLNRLQPEISLDECYLIVDQYRISENTTTDDVSSVVKSPIPSSKTHNLQTKSVTQLKADHPLVVEYMLARGLTFATLHANGIGFLAECDLPDDGKWSRDSLVFPYFHNGRCSGLRYRDIVSNKSWEKGSHFQLWELQRADCEGEESRIALLCEGESDALRVWQATQGKYAVYATPTAQFKREWQREFEGFQQVIFIPQGDEPGEKMLPSVIAALPSVTIIKLQWHKGQIGNDIPDWLRYHTENDLSSLIESNVNKQLSNKVLTGYEFDLEAQEPRTWLIENLLAIGQLVVIGGKAKALKTFSMLNIVHSLTMKSPLFGIPQFKINTESVPNCLIVEEEGAKSAMRKRMQMIYKTDEWRNNTFWAHHLGFKLDTDVWIQRLESEIQKYDINVVLIDPFQRVHSQNENEASDMGNVWNRLAGLMNRYPDLIIFILHHFGKNGKITDRWDAFRGSGRIGGEADLGIFVERMVSSEGVGTKMLIEGRDIETPLNHKGEEIFHLHFDEGRLLIAQDQQIAGVEGEFLHELIKRGGQETIANLVAHFKVSASTIRNYAARCVNLETGEIQVEVTKTQVIYKGEK